MNTRWLAVVAVMVGCGGDDSSDKTPDAPKAIDAPKPAVDATPVNIAKAKSHTLFLNPDGATVKPGSEDATTDTSPVVQTSVTFGAWLAGDANRATKIQGIASAIAQTLAPYDIAVVTTRPATGPYHEILVTDDLGTKLDPNFANVYALATTNCNLAPSAIGFIFPTNESPNEAARFLYVQDYAIGYFGFLNGLPVTTKVDDCMCVIDGNCANTACTIGGAGTPVDTSNSGMGTCGWTAATIDEAGAFLAAFGAHQ